MPKKLERPIILGIVGDSASGKTTLSHGIAKILGPERCTVICTDDYHSLDRRERELSGTSALNPKANYIDILEQHLRLLRSGQPILKPVYNHKTGTLDRPEYVAPNDYVITEGLLGYSTRAMRDCQDVKIYLHPEEELRIRWKIQRDTHKRGYSEAKVRSILEKRSNDSTQFIDPQRKYADIIIRFQNPPNSSGDVDKHLDVRQILRPTLPHPDFVPILQAMGDSHLNIELTRYDNKPVDVLEIDGEISDQRAERIEDYLWTLIPEAGHLRDNTEQSPDNVGAIENQDGIIMSHPLALTQLLVAYHVVKAELGEHVI